MRRTACTHAFTFSTFLSIFARAVRRTLKRMWDMAFRHGFGAVRVADNATEDRLVAREEGANEAYADASDYDTDLLFQDNTNHHIGASIPSRPPRNSTSNVWSAAAAHLYAPANSPRAPIDRVIGDPDYFTKSSASDGCPSLIEDPGEDFQDADMRPLREVQQRDFGEPFLTLTPEENAAMAATVAPAKEKLARLKELTPENMPTYHPNTHSNSYAQVLKSRLATIAQSIAFGKKMPEEERLRNELKVCRHIAAEYWPLTVTPTTHLDIHRIYRNALFRQTTPEQFRQDQTNHRIWAEEVVETKRPSMSFGEAASRFAGAQQAQQEIVDAAEAERMARRRQQEEEDRKAAEELDREINRPDPGLGGSAYIPSYNRDEAAQIAAQTLLKNVGQGANTYTQTPTQTAGVQYGAGADAYPSFESDEQLARWLQNQENSTRDDDVPDLIHEDQREREEQSAKDHALAMQLDEEAREAPVMGLGRTRSQTNKATGEANTTQDFQSSGKGKQAVVEDQLPTLWSRVARPQSLMGMSEYRVGNGQEVGYSEDDKYTALMVDSPSLSPTTSPTPRYGGQKRKEPEPEREPSGYHEDVWED